ncbi:transcription factor ILR3-like isoform X2 [Impatiens glandulifera]|uniref:transcription factor ILR3-like isoform X2 n=1 Tax=Impatiens glandulifera TaxID=253017 RepID=UPI001FB13A35|nr:transcription factor ILR3-like isoform X2 [Impatiens glandulifera]
MGHQTLHRSSNSMDIDSSQSSNWLLDYELMNDISDVPAVGFTPTPTASATCFSWPSPSPINSYSSTSCLKDSDGLKEGGSRKRSKPDSCGSSASRACREKLRRDKLNERFIELCSTLEPGKPPKTDKIAILSDAVRVVSSLRSETQKLRETNEDLIEKIKELKAEKNELRDEKQKLKVDNEKLEHLAKTMTIQQGFVSHHPSAVQGNFGAQAQAAANKLMPVIGYPGVAMWQFIPPTVLDTSQDHILRPPVA